MYLYVHKYPSVTITRLSLELQVSNFGKVHLIYSLRSRRFTHSAKSDSSFAIQPGSQRLTTSYQQLIFCSFKLPRLLSKLSLVKSSQQLQRCNFIVAVWLNPQSAYQLQLSRIIAQQRQPPAQKSQLLSRARRDLALQDQLSTHLAQPLHYTTSYRCFPIVCLSPRK